MSAGEATQRRVPAPLVRTSTAGIPRYRRHTGPVAVSGFRPFFLLSGVWACVAIPLWFALYAGVMQLPIVLAPAVSHGHEMIFGFTPATVAGFLLISDRSVAGKVLSKSRA